MRTAERTFRSDIKVLAGNPAYPPHKPGDFDNSFAMKKFVHAPYEIEDNLKEWYRLHANRVSQANATKTERKCFMFID